MSRNNFLLRSVNKEGTGLEIGPSHRPAAPKRDGYRVEIIDHLDREGLLAKYRDHNLNLDAIEEVDYIWSGQTYAELTGKNKHYDWIIASHVIEHTPDLVGFLNQCDSVLKDDGVLSLAIPDKRYCFDYHRPLTGLAKVVDHHVNGVTVNTPGTVAEYYLNVVKKEDHGAWNETLVGDCNYIHTLNHAKDGMNRVIERNTYIDCHVWCFVPHSFRLLIHDLHSLGLISFRELSFTRTHGSEFFVTLSKKGSGLESSRIDVAKEIERELFTPSLRELIAPSLQRPPTPTPEVA